MDNHLVDIIGNQNIIFNDIFNEHFHLPDSKIRFQKRFFCLYSNEINGFDFAKFSQYIDQVINFLKKYGPLEYNACESTFNSNRSIYIFIILSNKAHKPSILALKQRFSIYDVYISKEKCHFNTLLDIYRSYSNVHKYKKTSNKTKLVKEKTSKLTKESNTDSKKDIILENKTYDNNSITTNKNINSIINYDNNINFNNNNDDKITFHQKESTFSSEFPCFIKRSVFLNISSDNELSKEEIDKINSYNLMFNMRIENINYEFNIESNNNSKLFKKDSKHKINNIIQNIKEIKYDNNINHNSHNSYNNDLTNISFIPMDTYHTSDIDNFEENSNSNLFNCLENETNKKKNFTKNAIQIDSIANFHNNTNLDERNHDYKINNDFNLENNLKTEKNPNNSIISNDNFPVQELFIKENPNSNNNFTNLSEINDNHFYICNDQELQKSKNINDDSINNKTTKIETNNNFHTNKNNIVFNFNNNAKITVINSKSNDVNLNNGILIEIKPKSNSENKKITIPYNLKESLFEERSKSFFKLKQSIQSKLENFEFKKDHYEKTMTLPEKTEFKLENETNENKIVLSRNVKKTNKEKSDSDSIKKRKIIINL